MRPHPRETPTLVGHREHTLACLDKIRRQCLPHALLLQGPKGIGKATFAYHLIRELFAETSPTQGPNLDVNKKDPPPHWKIPDPSLFRRVRALSHRDLKIVERTPDSKGQRPRDISIAQIRDLISFFAKTPLEGGWRIALIDSIDEMTLQAANALLKVLEEPPQKSLLILINHTPGQLLPTLSSRCHKRVLRPLTDEETLEVLQKARSDREGTPVREETTVQRAGELFPGRPGIALGFLDHKNDSLLEAFGRLTEKMLGPQTFDPFLFLDQVFPPREGSFLETFTLLSQALLEWLDRLIKGGLYETLSPSCQAFFRRKTLLTWTRLYTELSTLFQETERLSYDRRHVFLVALLRIRGSITNMA